MSKSMHFRVNTPQLLSETLNNALKGPQPEVKACFRILISFLGKVSQRCADINDPVLNRLMFDMNLYDLPLPGTKEYTNIMEKLYEAEEQYLKSK